MESQIGEYLLFERDPLHIMRVRKCHDESERKMLFGKRIAFGTAGLRGPMRAGISGMNCGTVWRATQGLCQYWINTIGLEECRRRGAVVGFDGRHNSEYLASITAAVFMTKRIPVIFADEVTATPLTPHQIVTKGAFCGVQVTASHNPKQDNGYKVYAQNGAQIIPPMDRDIAAEIERQAEPWLEVDDIVDHQLRRLNPIHSLRPLARLCLSDSWQHMRETIFKELGVSEGSLSSSHLRVVYTAMHGVGYRFVEDLIRRSGFPAKQFLPVSEQMYPDPEFPTVQFPNPEELGALDLAKAVGAKKEADYIIANDPDADRFAAAERGANGEWRVFTGDELGAIFGMIAYENWARTSHESDAKCSFVCSAVSCTFLRRYSQISVPDGLAVFRETLTGFKWMINVALEMERSEKIEPCFCYEEALGYGLCVKSIPDKCGLSATMAFMKKADELQQKGLTIGAWLDAAMRDNGGYFATENSYYVASDPSVTKEVINNFRHRFLTTGTMSAGTKIAGFDVTRIRDLGRNYDSSTADGHCELPAIDEMLTLEFANGARITIRGSGTEPKLKYYSEMVSQESIAAAKKELKTLVSNVLKEVLHPLTLKHASEL